MTALVQVAITRSSRGRYTVLAGPTHGRYMATDGRYRPFDGRYMSRLPDRYMIVT